MTRPGLAWSEIAVPVELAEVVDEISYQRVVMNPGATWDYFPRPLRPGYAESHGIRRFSSTRCTSRGSSTGSRPTGRAPTVAWCGARCHWSVRSTRAIPWSAVAGWSTRGATTPARPPDTRRPRDQRLQPARRIVLSRRGNAGVVGLDDGQLALRSPSTAARRTRERPSAPNSRPMPDCLNPPNGAVVSSVYMLMP